MIHYFYSGDRAGEGMMAIAVSALFLLAYVGVIYGRSFQQVT